MEEQLVVSGEAELAEADLVAVVAYLPELKQRWWLPLATGGFTATLVVRHSVWLAVAQALVVALLVVLFQRRITRSWPKHALTNLGAGATTFRFDDFGFSASSSLRQHRLAWSSLARYVEAPDAFVIYTTPRTLLVAPKRAFALNDVPRVSELLRARVIANPATASSRAALKRVLLAWLILIVAFGAIWLLLNEEPRREAPAAPAPIVIEPRGR